jgi:hypothetical protein
MLVQSPPQLVMHAMTAAVTDQRARIPQRYTSATMPSVTTPLTVTGSAAGSVDTGCD